jgi:hypothetical protein
MRIGEVAEQAGVNIQTMRYYERRELVVPLRRRASGTVSTPPAEWGPSRFSWSSLVLDTFHEWPPWGLSWPAPSVPMLPLAPCASSAFTHTTHCHEPVG